MLWKNLNKLFDQPNILIDTKYTHPKVKMSKDLLNLDNLSTYWEITSPSGILIDGIKKISLFGHQGLVPI